jgi:hypothetical protein
MSVQNVEIFKKQSVTRPSSTSMLTSLLLSPKITCDFSPNLPSSFNVFGDSDSLSRTNSSSPSTRTPPRRACISFAAAQPKTSPAELRSQFDDLARFLSDTIESKSPLLSPTAISPSHLELGLATDFGSSEVLPIVGSVFDEYSEEQRCPVARDRYRIGQPKKLVDDCLKKEETLRVIATTVEGEEAEDGDDYDGYVELEDEPYPEGVEEDDGSLYEDDMQNNIPQIDDITASAHRLATALALRLNLSDQQASLPPHSVYTPSRDVIDNFVPGNLDEDRFEAARPIISKISLRDIDPTYPSDEEDEVEVQSPSNKIAIISPVRFHSKNGTKAQPLFKPRMDGLSRTLSLPWNHRRSPTNSACQYTQRNLPIPRWTRNAITISKSIDYKRHSRREKKVNPERQCCDGAEAMAAMARQLTGKQALGPLASSI